MGKWLHKMGIPFMAAPDGGAPAGGVAETNISFAEPPGGLGSLADIYGPLMGDGESEPKKTKAPASGTATDGLDEDADDLADGNAADDEAVEGATDEDAEAPAKAGKGKAAEEAPKLVDRVVGNKLVKMTAEAAEALDAETERQASERRQSSERPQADVDPKQAAKEYREATGRLDRRFSEIVNDTKDFDGFTDALFDLVTPRIQFEAKRIADAQTQSLQAELAELRDQFASVAGDSLMEQQIAGEIEESLEISGFEGTELDPKDVKNEMKRIIAASPNAFKDISSNGHTVRRALDAAVVRLSRAAHKPGRPAKQDDPEDVEMANLRESRPPAPNASAPSPGSGYGVSRGSQGNRSARVDPKHMTDAEFLASRGFGR